MQAWDPYFQGGVDARLMLNPSSKLRSLDKGRSPGLVSNNFKRLNLRKGRSGHRIGAQVQYLLFDTTK